MCYEKKTKKRKQKKVFGLYLNTIFISEKSCRLEMHKETEFRKEKKKL